MPRRHTHRRPAAPLRGTRERVETRRGEQWHVRALTGATSGKDYTCPGCYRPVPAGSAHVVVWPVERPLLSASAIDERRHWHTACWARG